MISDKETTDLIEIVYEDLLHLKAEASPDCTDHQLRRVSVELRRLLNDDHLIQAWKAVGMTPKAPTIVAPHLDTSRYGDSDIAAAGYAEMPGGIISGISIINRAHSVEEIKANCERHSDLYEVPFGGAGRSFPLAEYKDSTAVYFKGIRIKRCQIVAFVANKLGGAHLDTKRNKKGDEAYKCLDEIMEVFFVGGTMEKPGGPILGSKSAVYSELMSIAQHLTASPDIQRFVNECRRVLGR